jgi:hypothetical protein
MLDMKFRTEKKATMRRAAVVIRYTRSIMSFLNSLLALRE